MKNYGLARSCVVILAVAFALCVYETAQAYDGGAWGSRGSAASAGSWGSSGGFASSGGGYASSGGHASSGGYGSSGGHHRHAFRPVRNFFSAVHQSHQRRWGGSSGGFASSGGTVYSGGSSGGSSGGYTYRSSMGSMGSAFGSSAVYSAAPSQQYMPPANAVVEPEVTPQSGAVPTLVPDAVPSPASADESGTEGTIVPPTPAPASDSDTRYVPQGQQDAILNVDLPAQAKVWINGHETSTEGSFRSYVSRDLETGKHYEFDVKAVIQKEGREIAMNRKVTLQAGLSELVKFDFEQPQLTQLSLKVPSDALVTLSGNPTTAKGEVRYFKSRTLKPGESWSDYRITVTVVRDGKDLVAEKILNIESGQDYVLDFDFSQPDLYVSR